MRQDKDRVVLITGGAAGIGWATARRFAAAGDRVVIADIDGARAEARAAELTAAGFGAGHSGIATDIADPAQVQAMIGHCTDTLGGLDVLVNNAGRIDTGGTMVVDQPLAAFNALLNVNLRGSYRAAMLAAEVMAKAGGGGIVNMASGAALRAIPLRNGYSASKAGVVAYTRDLACKLAGSNIRVNALLPGYIRTELVDALIANNRVDPVRVTQRIPLGRMGRPEEMAAVVYFLASPSASYMAGSLFIADGGSQAYGGSDDASQQRGAAPQAPPQGRPVVVVAGAAPDIRSAFANALIANNAEAVVLDDAAGGNLESYGAALSAEIANVATQRGRLDGVINLHGAARVIAGGEGRSENDTDDHLARAFLTAQAAGRVMLKQGYGAMVNVTSIRGQVALDGNGLLAAETAGIGMLGRTLACEWGGSGIRANTIAAGAVEGGIDWTGRIPLGRPANWREIADVAAFLAGPDSGYVNGSIIAVDGGLSAYAGSDLA
ncbi:SDR family oxidoreductase [Ferrovibrio sp.]|uniref:SDR family oxidoreductase n=1 Tax=Ferrovibrio sp. TaxID=1917215 RepID=UPI0035B2DEAE